MKLLKALWAFRVWDVAIHMNTKPGLFIATVDLFGHTHPWHIVWQYENACRDACLGPLHLEWYEN
jgi:hypothetical protein